MIAKRAVQYYSGQGVKRLNCAQSVATAFSEISPLEGVSPADFAHASGGRAPQGYCGALFAALAIADKTAPAKGAELKDFFLNNAGGLTCRDIRSNNKFKCVSCVEHAARLLS